MTAFGDVIPAGPAPTGESRNPKHDECDACWSLSRLVGAGMTVCLIFSKGFFLIVKINVKKIERF